MHTWVTGSAIRRLNPKAAKWRPERDAWACGWRRSRGIPGPTGVIWWTQPPQVNLAQTPDYRETYANSVQVRVSVWDFQLVFGLASSESPEQVTVRNHQAIFLSPQQAKALWNILGQNLAQYEQAFGTLNLEPKSHNFPQGPVN